MRKVTINSAISPPLSLCDSRETPGVHLDYHVCLKTVTFSVNVSAPKIIHDHFSNKNMFKIPDCAAILAELLKNGLPVCCVPCSAYTVLSTITVSFMSGAPFPSHLSWDNKKEEQFDEGTGWDRSGCKKAPQGTNPYHTITYGLHEDSW